MTAARPALAFATGRTLAMSVLGVGALSPGLAWAAPPADVARAQVLFEAARELQGAGQVADACPMFAESKRLAPGVGVTLHLADCYERVGRPASAWDQFREAEQLARARGDETRAALAHKRADALVERLDRLTVATSPGIREGTQISLDGVVLPPDRLNAALAVDPGDHAVTIQAPGHAPRTMLVHLDAGKPIETVQVDDAPKAPFPAPVATATLTPPAATATLTPPAATAVTPTETVAREPVTLLPIEPQNGRRARVVTELALVGVGALGIGFGTFFLVRRSELMSHGQPRDPELENQASIAATVSFVAGGAALTSAVVLYLTGTARSPQSGWVLAPIPLEGGAGALVRASF
jgi:hypothetical protein